MSSLQARFSVSGPNCLILKNGEKGSVNGWSCLQFRGSNAKEFWVSDQKGFSNGGNRLPNLDPVFAQGMHSYWNHQKWWEKNLQPNMIEINSAQQLVDNLLNADDKLVILHFFAPSCGGCKALHPKICQIAESNPDAIFLGVNHEEHRAMCYALRVHVLPFFSFYRGAKAECSPSAALLLRSRSSEMQWLNMEPSDAPLAQLKVWTGETCVDESLYNFDLR